MAMFCFCHAALNLSSEFVAQEASGCLGLTLRSSVESVDTAGSRFTASTFLSSAAAQFRFYVRQQLCFHHVHKEVHKVIGR